MNDCILIPKNSLKTEIVKNLKDEVSIVCELYISINVSVFIADLTALLPLVTELEKKYNPFTTQCYWYTSTIYKVV